ncbi:MAG: hypothetical protein ACRD50_16635 [Candidatus Acidiferrales bacterium]
MTKKNKNAKTTNATAPFTARAVTADSTKAPLQSQIPKSFGEAMHAVGLDDRYMAEKLKVHLDRVGKPGMEKHFLDSFKEWGKLASAYPAPDRAPSAPEAVSVQLVHNVPRPSHEESSKV